MAKSISILLGCVLCFAPPAWASTTESVVSEHTQQQIEKMTVQNVNESDVVEIKEIEDFNDQPSISADFMPSAHTELPIDQSSANEFSSLALSSQAPPTTVIRYSGDAGGVLKWMKEIFAPTREVNCLNMTDADLKDMQSILGKNVDKSTLCPKGSGKEKSEDDSLSFDMGKMVSSITAKFGTSPQTARQIVTSSHEEARKRKLDPVLVLSMIAAESSFNPRAVSHAGAVGLMLAIPRWHGDKMKSLGISHKHLYNIKENIMLGTAILREYLNLSGGNTKGALQRYNGAVNDKSQRYSNKVLKHYRWLKGV